MPKREYTNSKQNFSENSKIILTEWLNNNFAKPFASRDILIELAIESALTEIQVSNWLKYARKKIKKKAIKKIDLNFFRATSWLTKANKDFLSEIF